MEYGDSPNRAAAGFRVSRWVAIASGDTACVLACLRGYTRGRVLEREKRKSRSYGVCTAADVRPPRVGSRQNVEKESAEARDSTDAAASILGIGP